MLNLNVCTSIAGLEGLNDTAGAVGAVLDKILSNVSLQAPPLPSELSAFGRSSEPCFLSEAPPSVLVGVLIKAEPSLSASTLVLALIYTDRFLKETGHSLTSLGAFSLHRLFLVGLICAVKFNQDLPFANGTFSAILEGLNVSVLASLERQFCQTLEYRLNVEEETFGEYVCLLKPEKSLVLRRTRSSISCDSTQPSLAPSSSREEDTLMQREEQKQTKIGKSRLAGSLLKLG
jgi:hypothetical protein